MKEQQPSSQLPEIHKQDPYKKQTEQTIKEVMGFHILSDYQENKIKSPKPDYAQKRLPVLFDALSRGEDIIIGKIERLEFQIDIPRMNGIRQYAFNQDGQLIWRDISKSSDPFLQLKFIRQYQSNGQPIEGTTDLWTNKFFINQMIIEGIKQQEEVYNQFEQAQRYIQTITTDISLERRNLDSSARDTLESIPSASEEFEKFQQFVETFEQQFIRSGEQDPKDFFIQALVAKNHPRIHTLRSVVETAEALIKIRGFFDLSTQSFKRSVLENTLPLLLIIRPPEQMSEKDWRNPYIKGNELLEVFKFLKQERVLCSTQQEFNDKMEILSLGLFDHHRQTLKEVLDNLQIPYNLGREYLLNIVRSFLQTTTAYEIVSSEDTDPNVLKQHGSQISQFAHSIYLPEEWEKISIEEARLRFISPKNTADYIDNWVKTGKFSTEQLAALQLNQVKRLLNRAFYSKPLSIREDESINELSINRIERQRLKMVQSAFEALKVVYDPNSRVFLSSNPEDPEGKINKAFLDVLSGYIEQNPGPYLEDYIGTVMLKETVNDYIIKNNLAKDYLEYSQLIISLRKEKSPDRIRAIVKNGIWMHLQIKFSNLKSPLNTEELIQKGADFLSNNLPRRDAEGVISLFRQEFYSELSNIYSSVLGSTPEQIHQNIVKTLKQSSQ